MNHHPGTTPSFAHRFVAAAITFLFIAILYTPAISAQIVAPAGSIIGNQATATYTDANSVSRQAFSNLVQTSVTQVYAGYLTQSQNKYATPGTQVYFPHTFTNSGNGPDSVTLTAGTGTNLSNIAIYIDANGDGIPDNTTNISGTSLPIASGGVIKVVAVATLNAGASAGGSFNVTAAIHTGGVITGTNPNVDTVNYSANGVISVTKSMTAASSGGVSTVTLSYTNTGNSTATGVNFIDDLAGQAQGFTYCKGTTAATCTSGTGSGTWNGTAFTDASGGVSGLTWTTPTANVINVTVASVASGVTGTITFNVLVPTLNGSPATLTNYAKYLYVDGGGNSIPSNNTNTVSLNFGGYDFAQFTAGTPGTFTQSTISGSGAAQTHTTNAGANVIASASYNQGATITWTDTLTNDGTLTDTYNLTLNTTGTGTANNPSIVAASQFPAGTIFQLYHADGKTPLTDTNGDGVVDSGPLSTGSTQVVITATLPAGFTSTGGTYIVNLIATPTNSTATNFGGSTVISDVNQLEVIVSATKNASVDLVGTSSVSGTGSGVGKSAESITTYAGNPGSVIAVPFYLFNTGTNGTPDAYNLSFTYNGTANVGNLTTPLTAFTTQAGTVPAASGASSAWTVQIAPATAANCSTYGAPITATSVMATGTNTEYCLVMQVPVSYPASTYHFTIQAQSGSSASIDQMAVEATVNTFHNVSINPSNSNQIYPSGTVVYKHVVTNGGNVTETATVGLSNPTLLATPAGWSVAAWLDADGNGVLSSGDTSLTLTSGYTIPSLAPGASITYFLVVQAPASANPGDQQIATWNMTLTGDSTGANLSVTDTTTVISGQVKLAKSQSVIPHTPGTSTCATTPGAWITSIGQAGSKDCIFYQIVATNAGTTNVTGPSITDSAPAYTIPYTSYNGGVPSFTNTCSMTNPTTASLAFGAGNTFTGAYSAGSIMTPGCTITAIFEVQLN